jgi:hypothetical protein
MPLLQLALLLACAQLLSCKQLLLHKTKGDLVASALQGP